MITRVPDKVIRHPNFIGSTLNNDVCMLYVKEPIVFDSITSPACLPPISPEYNSTLTGNEVPEAKCYIAGWGKTSEKGKIASVLQELQVPIIKHEICSSSTVYGSNVKKDQMICAGFLEGGKDGCQGDSGGPFVCIEGNNQPVLRGVISWGVGCARQNSPGVYARVSNYMQWIIDNIKLYSPISGICYCI